MIRSRVDAPRAQKANRVLWNLFIILLLMTITALCFFYVFLIRHIEFTGSERFDEDELIRMTGLVYEESMLLIDKQQVIQSMQTNPYIAVQEIWLVWPDTVRIAVRERTGCALTRQLESTLLLDREGVVLSTDAAVLQNQMCEVTGWEVLSSRAGETLETKQSLQLAGYAAVAGELERFGIAQNVRQIDVEDVLNLSLIMRDGMHVKLGDTSNMTVKITWLAQMLEELKQDGYSGGTLDLTSGNSASYLPPDNE